MTSLSAQHGPTWVRLTAIVGVAAVVAACGGGATSTEGLASASPATSSGDAAASSAPPRATTSAVVHRPGTVPSSAPSARAAGADTPLPAVPPKVERRPARPSPQKATEGVGPASWIDGRHVGVSSPGRLEIVDVEATTSVVLTTGARIREVAASATRLVTLDESNRIVTWDLDGKASPRAWSVPALTNTWSDAHVAVSAGGEHVAYATDVVLKVWDAERGAELLHVAREVPSFQLLVTKDEVVATSNNVAIQAWRIEGGAPTASTGFDTGATFGLQVSPDGRWGAAGAPSGHGLSVSEVRRAGTLRLLVDSDDCRHHVAPAFSADGRYVYALLGTDWVKGFETGSWKPYASYRAEPGREIAAMADDLGRVVTTKDGTDPRLVAVSTTNATPLERPFDGLASYAFNADGSLLLGQDERGEVRVWAAPTAKVVFEIAPD